jgi:adenosylmethionine-8-amino-7-oxononanoate aminotransferase
MTEGEMDRIWHPFTKFSALANGPLPDISGGEGIYLVDSAGRRYVDAISSWWCTLLGHGHPRLVKAIRAQAGRLQQSILGGLSNPWAVELAERLSAKMPTPERHVMFSSDGSCAVDAALKIAAQYYHNKGIKGRDSFLTLEQDYHGDTVGAVGVGFVPGFHEPFGGIVKRAHTVPLPDYKNGEGFKPTLDAVERHGEKLAAVIVEPLCQGSAGMRMYEPRYLSELAALLRERGILLIVDEIAMGFGRTGRYWAFEHSGIDPDIVCVGKAVTGGYLPLSAAICRDEIYDTFTDSGDSDNTFYHGHTFGGNPIAAACALEAMDIYDEMDVASRVAALGELMAGRLRGMEGRPGVREVRCLGLIGAVELEPSDNTAERAVAVREFLKEKGVLLRPLGDVFYLFPPAVIKEDELESLCDVFMEAVTRFA